MGETQVQILVAHISTPCSLGCIIHRNHCIIQFTQHHIWFIYKRNPSKSHNNRYYHTPILFWRQEPRPPWTPPPHLLPPLWFRGVCVACQVFISELWHLNQDCDPRAKQRLRCPSGHHNCCQPLCLNGASAEVFGAKTSWESLWHPANTEWTQSYVDWKEQCILVGGHASSVPSAQAAFWPWLYVHGLSVAAGSLTCPGCSSATSLAHAAPDWRSARVRFNETEATPKAGRSVLTSEHLCHMHRVWWELKLPQNSPSSCNYSNSWFVITQIIWLPETIWISVSVWSEMLCMRIQGCLCVFNDAFFFFPFPYIDNTITEISLNWL